MKVPGQWYRSALAGIALIAGLGMMSTQVSAQTYLAPGTATAGGTSANTDITNQATLSYSIGTTAQPVVNSNTTTFKVDNLVRVVVTEVGGTFTAVAPNAAGVVTTFTVTNTGNTVQDYILTPNGAIATAQSVVLGGIPYNDSNITAGFDVSGCSAFVESGATAGYQLAQDIARAAVSLSPVGGSNTVTVYVVCTVPSVATATNGNNALVSLTAQTAHGGSCTAVNTAPSCTVTTQTAGADTATAVDVVFADVAGSDDILRDGMHSARDVFQVAAAIISVSKTVTVVCDPLNFNVNPKGIPGAYVRYEITIANAATATASATLTVISDALNTNTSFDSDLRTGSAAACAASAPASAAGSGFRLTCTGGARGCVTTPVFYTTAADGDAMLFNTGAVTVRFGTGGGAVTGVQALPAEAGGAGYAAGELKPNESVTIRFNAVIN